MIPLFLGSFAELSWLVWSLLAVFGLLGLLAVLSPKSFERVSTCGSQWVHTEKLLAVLDRQYDVDGFVLRHCRLFGLLVLAAVAFLAYFYLSYLGGA